MPARSWKFIVGPEEAGIRLDQVLSIRTGLSRRKVREILKLGGVQVERRRVRVASKLLSPGSAVAVYVDDSLGPPPEFPVPVLFEDEWILAVDKPADLPTQGTLASDQHDLLAILRRQREGHLALLHRLDTGTSGILLFAKRVEAASSFGKLWQEQGVAKTYLARTAIPVEACKVDRAIGRVKGASPSRFGCEGELLEPKAASTVFRPATREETAGLVPGHYVVCEPLSGRTHQIRVHLTSLGAPILGDLLYGGPRDPMLWLHAWRLRLRHPLTGALLALEAPPLRFRAPLD